MAALIVNTTAQLNTSGSDSPAFAGVVLNQGFFSSSMGTSLAVAAGATTSGGSLYTGVIHWIAYAPGTAANTTAGFSHGLIFDTGNGQASSSSAQGLSLLSTGGVATTVSNDGLLTNITVQNNGGATRDIYMNIMLLSQ